MRQARADRLTLDNNGNVGIGTTNSNDGKLEVKGGTVCVDTNSDDSATSCIANESDERLKEDIAALSASSSLKTILALRPVSFDWRASDPEILKHYPLFGRFASSTHSIGLIAQEVMPVLPEALTLETVGDAHVQYYQLDYTKFIPHLVGAVRALAQEVRELASAVAAFSDKILTKELHAENVWTDRGHFKELCVGSVCVAEADFLRVFGASGAGSAPVDDSVPALPFENPPPAPETSSKAEQEASRTAPDAAGVPGAEGESVPSQIAPNASSPEEPEHAP